MSSPWRKWKIADSLTVQLRYLYNIIVIITLNVFGDLKKWDLSKMYW
jgi:hypothetical protein